MLLMMIHNHMLKTASLRAIALLAIGLLSASTAMADDAPWPEALPATEFNEVLVRIGEDLYIAGQPSEQGLIGMREAGVTTVVNLRTHMEMNNRGAVPFDEAAVLDELGIRYVHIPSGGPDTPYTPAMVDKLADALQGTEGKVLLHCTVAWRASHLYTAYLYRYRGMSMNDAVRHGRAINLGTLPLEEFLGEGLSIQIAED
jgi:uncharacterized protein (TIGR01244 family)